MFTRDKFNEKNVCLDFSVARLPFACRLCAAGKAAVRRDDDVSGKLFFIRTSNNEKCLPIAATNQHVVFHGTSSQIPKAWEKGGCHEIARSLYHAAQKP